ncbi:MAG: hypothetical protein IKU37_05535 [Candidatus Gastranaerophilales bacterium]|nr:hypothetical protein [Candidatus Gastranaerophilales bacterium]
MQINNLANYQPIQRIHFKGGQGAAQPEEPKYVTAEQFREFTNETAQALKAILGLLQANNISTFDIRDLKFKNDMAYTNDDVPFDGIAVSTLENGDKIESRYLKGKLKHVSRKGEKAFETEYFYNNGRLRKIVKTDADESETITKFQYGSNGHLEEKTMTTPTNKYTVEYSGEGKVKKFEKTDNEGHIIDYAKFDLVHGYITEGRINGAHIRVIDHHYGYAGLPITEIDYSDVEGLDENVDPIKVVMINEVKSYELNNGRRMCDNCLIFEDGVSIDMDSNVYTYSNIDEPYSEHLPIESYEFNKDGRLAKITFDLGKIKLVKLKTKSTSGGVTSNEYAKAITERFAKCYNIEFYPNGKIKTEALRFRSAAKYDDDCLAYHDFEISFDESGDVCDIKYNLNNSCNCYKPLEFNKDEIIKQLNQAKYKGSIRNIDILTNRAKTEDRFKEIKKQLKKLTSSEFGKIISDKKGTN